MPTGLDDVPDSGHLECIDHDRSKYNPLGRGVSRRFNRIGSSHLPPHGVTIKPGGMGIDLGCSARRSDLQRGAAGGMRRFRDLSVTWILAALAVLLAALGFVLARNQDRFGPWLRSLSLPVALLLVLLLAILLLLTLGGRFKKRRRPNEKAHPGFTPAPIPDDLARAAQIQADRAGEFIDRVSDPGRRAELRAS